MIHAYTAVIAVCRNVRICRRTLALNSLNRSVIKQQWYLDVFGHVMITHKIVRLCVL